VKGTNTRLEPPVRTDQPNRETIHGERTVVSVDTRKKELVGDSGNPGSEWQQKSKPEVVRVHDFIDRDLGKVIPHGFYDTAGSEAWVSVGVEHDTAGLRSPHLSAGGGRWAARLTPMQRNFSSPPMAAVDGQPPRRHSGAANHLRRLRSGCTLLCMEQKTTADRARTGVCRTRRWRKVLSLLRYI
jgi:Rhodopirellula transposase DDE domain